MMKDGIGMHLHQNLHTTTYFLIQLFFIIEKHLLRPKVMQDMLDILKKISIYSDIEKEMRKIRLYQGQLGSLITNRLFFC